MRHCVACDCGAAITMRGFTWSILSSEPKSCWSSPRPSRKKGCAPKFSSRFWSFRASAFWKSSSFNNFEAFRILRSLKTRTTRALTWLQVIGHLDLFYKKACWLAAVSRDSKMTPSCCIIELPIATITKAKDCIGQSLEYPLASQMPIGSIGRMDETQQMTRQKVPQTHGLKMTLDVFGIPLFLVTLKYSDHALWFTKMYKANICSIRCNICKLHQLKAPKTIQNMVELSIQHETLNIMKLHPRIHGTSMCVSLAWQDA